MLRRTNLFICALAVLQSVIGADEPEVLLSTGRVRGQRVVSAANRVFYSFRGIPYAQAPVGFLRFKAPRPPKSWNGTLEAFRIPAACSQPWRHQSFPEEYSEDCLYLNVFTPYMQPPEGKPMPVMVWIHGGKWYQGSSTSYKYGADFLVTGKVIIVTFNYRLGVFGYLNAKTRSAQGNAAHKDKVAVLRWVQREIAKFGGDPGSVTIFGGSSGAMDVHCLYISPMAKGLFHRAISESGGPCANVDRPSGFNPMSRLAELLGCVSTKGEAGVACLRGIPAEALAEVQMEVPVQQQGYENAFMMTVEEDRGEERFMPDTAEKVARKCNTSLPYIMGVNSGEGQMLLDDPQDNPTQFSEFVKNMKQYLPQDILDSASENTLDIIVKRVKEFYFENEEISYRTAGRFINFMTDTRFARSLIKMAQAVSVSAPVYLYYFAFEGVFKQPHGKPSDLPGVNHGDELGYLFFRNSVIPEHNQLLHYPREVVTITHMVRLWTNFAKYGNPTPNKTDHLLNVTWLPMNDSRTWHLVINDSLRMVTDDLLGDRMTFWEDMLSLATEKYSRGYSVRVVIVTLVVFITVVIVAYLVYGYSCKNGYVSL